MNSKANPLDAMVEAQALSWVIRMQRADFAEWDALTDWMDADPRHADSFNRLSLQDAEVASMLAVPSLPVPPSPVLAELREDTPRAAAPAERSSGTRPWMRIAASILLPVALAGGWLAHTFRSHPAPLRVTVLQTGPGERRDITLADGTRVALAGATSLAVDADGRHVRLLNGRAMFTVVHDPHHPFRVDLGDATVTDIGTVFDLYRWGARADVALSSGAALLTAGGQRIALRPGQRVRIDGHSVGQPQSFPIEDIGGWRRGSLTYTDATLAAIVNDLQAVTGAPIRANQDVANQHFAGSIQISGDAEQTLAGVAPLLGVSVRRDGVVWELVSPGRKDRR